MDEIFNTSEFMCRSNCGNWTSGWMAIYIASNIATGLSYLAIPVVMLGATKRGYPLGNHRWFTFSFAAFIFFCGMGHIFDEALSFVWPAYHFFAVWHFLTALASWSTAVTLPSILTSYVRR